MAAPVNKPGPVPDTLPETMRGVCASAFGNPADVLTVRDDLPVPRWESGKAQLLVRVVASSITPGDWRMLSGDVSAIREPYSWPYVPGMDVCGEVVALDPSVTGFSRGDVVVSTWGGIMAVGGMAEYCVVDADLTVLKPPALSPVDAAALCNSSVHALITFDEANIKSTDRVLVLGGNGGVGTSLLQLIKDKGVAMLAATGTDTDRLASLGVDRPIDYTAENWWELPEFKDEPLDLIIDLAEGGDIGWPRALSSKVLKTSWDGGRYYTLLLKTRDIHAKSKMFLLQFFGALMSRKAYTASLAAVNLAPAFQMKLSGPDKTLLTRVMDLGAKGTLKVMLVNNETYPFTTEGAIAAFDMLRSGHSQGKIVMKIADA
eukprot:m.115035 g.115035  ORF g.115035 m.115035 type:complete len:374 (+) comp10868_c0_seq4:2494-3615(+)